ncbi:hypothetical protein H9P43_002408 [Blastocladiella emersonii ATCC 22665]|nr:hypothetical protein H9P43_002408 [Blastocladiella emersonii ATCC 22665]
MAAPKRPEPQFIRLFDTAGTKVIDSVSTDYEDSFSLEAFGDLVKSHHALDCPPPKNLAPDAPPPPTKKRAFILARVQTWDHKQPEKAFYSYYDAHHLNKILFQTQVYLGKKLIHRIHVLNPLTNTDIIGNVLYFMVRPREDGQDGLNPLLPGVPSNVAKTAAVSDSVPALADLPPPSVTGTSPSKPPSRRASSNAVISSGGGGDPERAGAAASAVGAGRRTSTIRSTNGLVSRIITNGARPSTAPAAAGGAASNGSMSAVDPLTPQTWTMKTQLVTELSEEEGNTGAGTKAGLSPGGSRSVLRRMSATAANVTRRLSLLPSSSGNSAAASSGQRSATSSVASTRELNPKNERDVGTRSAPEHRTSRKPRSVSLNARSGGNGGKGKGLERRKTVGQVIVRNNITSKTPDGPLVINTHRTPGAKVAVPAGTVTRFAVPVPAEEVATTTPRTPPRRRRALSLSNSNQSPEAFNIWAANQLKTVNENNTILEEAGEGEHAAAATAAPIKSEPEVAAPSAPAATTESGGGKDEGVDIATYDMVLFATDNDFLESSKVRAVFRENALTPEDAVLFEMPPYTGEPSGDGADGVGGGNSENSVAAALPVVVFVDDDALCEACYPSPERVATMSPMMQTFHHCKCYFLALAFAVGIILFVLMSLRNASSSSSSPPAQAQNGSSRVSS